MDMRTLGNGWKRLVDSDKIRKKSGNCGELESQYKQSFQTGNKQNIGLDKHNASTGQVRSRGLQFAISDLSSSIEQTLRFQYRK